MENLVEQLFSKKWVSLLDKQNQSFAKHSDSTLVYPGVYLISYSEKITQGQEVKLDEVFYVGMSNSAKGVEGRLKQFVAAIQGEGMHSGGQRFKEDYAGRQPFHAFSHVNEEKRFHYAYLSTSCQVSKNRRTPSDLRKMGDVTCLEYYALAHIKSVLGMEPQLNKK